jgi:hypothetical protein
VLTTTGTMCAVIYLLSFMSVYFINFTFLCLLRVSVYTPGLYVVPPGSNFITFPAYEVEFLMI